MSTPSSNGQADRTTNQPLPFLSKEVEDGPVEPIAFHQSWIDAPAVQGILDEAEETGDSSAFPILADLLVDLGCTDTRIPDHLREAGRHGPDCWVARGLNGLPSVAREKAMGERRQEARRRWEGERQREAQEAARQARLDRERQLEHAIPRCDTWMSVLCFLSFILSLVAAVAFDGHLVTASSYLNAVKEFDQKPPVRDWPTRSQDVIEQGFDIPHHPTPSLFRATADVLVFFLCLAVFFYLSKTCLVAFAEPAIRPSLRERYPAFVVCCWLGAIAAVLALLTYHLLLIVWFFLWLTRIVFLTFCVIMLALVVYAKASESRPYNGPPIKKRRKTKD